MPTLDTLPESWVKVSPDDALKFEAELRKELCSLHPLFGVAARCLARSESRDDFLFSLPAHSRPLAVVHLTWSRETTSDFPWTTFFDSADDFMGNWKRVLE